MTELYYGVYKRGGHDIWLHETEPVVLLDMSSPPAHGAPVHPRGAMCLECLGVVKAVVEEAERILKTPREVLELDKKDIYQGPSF